MNYWRLRLQRLEKFNPYHDEMGRFTTAQNAVTISGGEELDWGPTPTEKWPNREAGRRKTRLPDMVGETLSPSERAARIKETSREAVERLGIEYPEDVDEPDEVVLSEPGRGTMRFTADAGERPGKTLLKSSFGWQEVDIDVAVSGSSDKGGAVVGISPETLAASKAEILATLNEISPEYRPRRVEISNAPAIGGGQFAGGTTIYISPWALPGLSEAEAKAMADHLYGERPTGKDAWRREAAMAFVTQRTEAEKKGQLATALRHETGHYVDSQIHRQRQPDGKRGIAFRQWRNVVSKEWEAKTEPFFRNLFPEPSSHAEVEQRRSHSLFYTAATHGWSNDTYYESHLNGVDNDSHRDAELFAEWFRHDLERREFPNGHIIGRHVRSMRLQTPRDGDGDGVIYEGLPQERIKGPMWPDQEERLPSREL